MINMLQGHICASCEKRDGCTARMDRLVSSDNIAAMSHEEHIASTMAHKPNFSDRDTVNAEVTKKSWTSLIVPKLAKMFSVIRKGRS